MENPGERLVGDYLRFIKGCHFVDFNVYTTAVQGEIDVVAVNQKEKRAYICEVVTHLTTGVQYVKNKRPDTTDRLIKKFRKDIEYGIEAFRNYEVAYMLWTPVVRTSSGKAECNQSGLLAEVISTIQAESGILIEIVCNQDYLERLAALRLFASGESKELKSPLMRLLQIEEWTKKHVRRIERRKKALP